MNNDLVNKALDGVKAVQNTVADAIAKSAEKAQPLFDQAVTQATELKDTLAHNVADVSEAAQPHIEGALGQLSHLIEMGKSALETGVAKAHEQLDPLAEQLKATIDPKTAATEKTPEDAAPE